MNDSSPGQSQRHSLHGSVSSSSNPCIIHPQYSRRHTTEELTSPIVTTSAANPSPQKRRRSTVRYDASHAMDRLRSTFIKAEDGDELRFSELPALPLLSIDDGNDDRLPRDAPAEPSASANSTTTTGGGGGAIQSALGQVPAVVLIGMFHLMIGIPFGVSYFPVGWRADAVSLEHDNTTTTMSDSHQDITDDENVRGPFPLPGKEALGIRMFLFSTIVGQIVYTMFSHFDNPIGLQMVENVPFCHELAAICIAHQGYGVAALATLFVLYGIASVFVGMAFYLLGKLELGRIVYFFPVHVLVGCIGGIGVYIAKTGLEVTMDASVSSFDNLVHKWHLLSVTFLLEIILRVLERVTLDKNGRPTFALLSPIYFCMITPMFYGALWILRVPLVNANAAGYFFPRIATAASETGATTITTTTTSWALFLQDDHMWDMWKVLDVRQVSVAAIFDSIPTLVALTLFSLIHVPINIPAFAISTNTDVDMNNELIAHGYSNMLAGIFGGLQNYMAYTQSVLYDRSGGKGRPSGFAVALITSLLFVIGPTIASYIPRCMAGALLLHVGIDLFLEGIYDSLGKFDRLEYCGIWLIVVVMTLYGMEAAMIAGVIAAVSTYAVQSITYLTPIRGSMSAVTLRSSHRSRNYQATTILDHPTKGRACIIVIQLQGHLFFGNMAQLNRGIQGLLEVESVSAYGGRNASPRPLTYPRRIVIVDFSLVLGIDSSAAQGLIKLRNTMQKHFHVDVCIFVAGSDEGFPCEFNLSDELTSCPHHQHATKLKKEKSKQRDRGNAKNGDVFGANSFEGDNDVVSEATSLLHAVSSDDNDGFTDDDLDHLKQFSGSYVLESLDLALIFAENVLIAWEDPMLLDDYDLTGAKSVDGRFRCKASNVRASPSSLITNSILTYTARSSFGVPDEAEEKELALRYLSNTRQGRNIDISDVEILLSHMERQTYVEGEFLWKQGDPSDCAKLLVSGMLISLLENEAGTRETVRCGNVIGELGLVQGSPRMSSVQCISEQGAVLYSLSRETYEELTGSSPRVARLIDLICIEYLASRVQHVSNRIFETRCLPI